MLYLIGLGLNEEGFSRESHEVIKKCKKVYLDNYTVELPYSIGELGSYFSGKKIILADRKFVESEKIVDEAKRLDVALLIYGSPLMATTHLSLIQEAKRLGIKYKVLHAGSILDAVAETGLQIYKFGKITSIPNFKADSFITTVKENQSIGAHTLLLVDIGLSFKEALKKLEDAAGKNEVKLKKILICSRLGFGKGKIVYDFADKMSDLEIQAPFSIIVPGKLHFVEKEFLEGL